MEREAFYLVMGRYPDSDEELREWLVYQDEQEMKVASLEEEAFEDAQKDEEEYDEES